MSKNVLTLRDVSKVYHLPGRTLTVLDDINLAIAEGESCAIIGPSGSGKTTLLGLCAGLDLPTAGSIRFLGSELTDMSEDERAALRNENVGFVFQSFRLIPTLTALENVMVPAELRGDGSAGDRAVELLKTVGLGDRLRHYPSQLSGGEQQRVALARAFINRPRVLFADEPTGNLDLQTGSLIEDMIFELNTSARTTLILVTHDERLARKTDRIVELQGGRLVADSGVATQAVTLPTTPVSEDE